MAYHGKPNRDKILRGLQVPEVSFAPANCHFRARERSSGLGPGSAQRLR